MKYYSTNHTAPEVTLGEAVVRGLAPDKGLYMPERIEKLPRSFYDGIASMSFHEIACRVAEAFFGDDIEHETLRKIVCDTLSFETPVVRVGRLWHSKTSEPVSWPECCPTLSVATTVG